MRQSTVAEFHRDAMLAANDAFLVKMRGEDASQLYGKALELESQAAMLLVQRYDVEPTRAILFKSSAVLALECGKSREAEKYIAFGLSGNPPEDIAEDLRNLYEDVNFKRHLDLQGLVLGEAEFQLSLSGNAISYGGAATRDVYPRLESAERLLERTAMRMLRLPFNGKDNRKIISDNYVILNSVARAACYSVTYKLGSRSRQLSLWSDRENAPPQSSEIICDFIHSLGLFERDEFEQLREHVQTADYFENFVGLARKILPDGKNVTLVGITSMMQGEEQSLALRSIKKQIYRKPYARNPRNAIFRGVLKAADGVKSSIKIIDPDSNDTIATITVSDALMDDIVKPMWNEAVEVEANRIKGKWQLEDIRRQEQSS